MSKNTLISLQNKVVSYSEVRDILFLAITEIIKLRRGQHFNERYLHHFFSREFQKIIPIAYSSESQFHPEWATFSLDNRCRGAKYKKTNTGYKVDDSTGSSGYIDFTIGDLKSPYFAVEFKMSESLDKQGIVYDYIKLLDKRNPFRVAVSLVVYYGLKRKSGALTIDNLNKIFESALNELRNDRFDSEREFHFFILEVNEAKSLVYERSNNSGSFQIDTEYIH